MSAAQEILNQLGGNKFIAMTGAKHLADLGNGLQFRVGRNKEKVSSVVIELGADDTYTVRYYKIRGVKIDLLKESKGVYCDQLRQDFETNTGLYTSL